MSIWFEEIFVKNCGAIVVLDGRQKILIINLQRLKQAHEKNPDIFPLRACPFFTNFILSRQITNFQEFIEYYLCIGKKNPQIIVVQENKLTQVDSQKPIKFYLQIGNLDEHPNAQIAFLI
jgi:hypothetical protein